MTFALLALAALDALFTRLVLSASKPWSAIALALLGVGAWLALSGPIARRVGSLRPGSRRLLLVGGALAYLALQLTLTLTTARLPGFDAMVLFSAAQNEVLGVDGGAFYVRYFTLYPFNELLETIYYVLFSTVHAFGGGPRQFTYAACLMNGLFLTTSALLTLKVARRLLGGVAAVFCTGLVAVFLLLSPWLHVVYSDTVGMMFPIAMLAVASAVSPEASGWRRLLPWLAIGVLGGIGMSIKPTVVFALVGIVGGPLLLRPRSFRSHGPAVAAAALAFLVIRALVPVGIHAADISPIQQSDPGGAFPITSQLAMGTEGSGGYNPQDVGEILRTPDDERSALGLRLYKERVKALGASGYARLLNDKLTATLDQGTFGQWGEGGLVKVAPLRDDGVSRFVQSFYDAYGSRHGIAVGMWDGVWLVGLALLCVPLVLRRGWARRFDALFPIALSLVLLLAFHTVFQTRARYLYLYAPFLLVLMSGGALQVRGAVTGAVRRSRAERTS
ncbi:glycosyltransferase family 39 protein [Nocardioides panacihumi]|uniref:glycosyltransferase family 39 protein n=1 Tax=Nocardioides panacihumi TaxID=400774 RepID=UPI0031D4E8EB